MIIMIYRYIKSCDTLIDIFELCRCTPKHDIPRRIFWSVDLVFSLLKFKHRVTHKRWDCKDDRKLLKYDDSKVKLSFCLRYSCLMAYLMIWQRNKQVYI